jgi:hypothetical protein
MVCAADGHAPSARLLQLFPFPPNTSKTCSAQVFFSLKRTREIMEARNNRVLAVSDSLEGRYVPACDSALAVDFGPALMLAPRA